MLVERRRPPEPPFDSGHPDDDEGLALVAAQAPLGIPRRWTHYLFFAAEADALAVADELAEQWEVDVQAAPDGDGWTVHVSRDGVRVSVPAVQDARATLTALTGAHHGEYDGWRAWV